MSLEDLIALLEARLRGRVETDRPLAPLTTYRLGGPARIFVEPADTDDLLELGAVLAEDPELPVLALGRGSNLVVSDRGWPGVVVRIGPALTEVRAGSDGFSAGAGVALPTLANWAARRALTGLEWAVGIPGTVGGGIRMNAGAHGGEMSAVVSSVLFVDLRTGRVEQRIPAELEMTYRHSALGDTDIVFEAGFHLEEADPEEIRRRTASLRTYRAETQPGAAQNAGSVFKNPPGDSAGRLVEAAGLKGFRVGGVHVSDLHANFFIADRGAASDDVRRLVAEVSRRVQAETGVRLEPEIRFAGSFAAHT